MATSSTNMTCPQNTNYSKNGEHRGSVTMWFLITTEVFPFSKYGGLADYIYSFGKALTENRFEVVVLSPYYENCMLPLFDEQKSVVQKQNINFKGKLQTYEKLTFRFNEINFVFFRSDHYFGFPKMWREDYVEGTNFNIDIYSFLGACAAQEISDQKTLNPHNKYILQANDWISAFFILYLKAQHQFLGEKLISVFCLHNFGPNYRGTIYRNDINSLDSTIKSHFTSDIYKDVTWTELLWCHYDKIITVSNSYAQELTSADTEAGRYLQIQSKNHHFLGVLNGINCEYWSPYTSIYTKEFCNSFDSLASAKAAAKSKLSKIIPGFNFDTQKVISFIGRITQQKGLSAINDLLKNSSEFNTPLVILGEGDDLSNYISELNTAKIVHIQKYSEYNCHWLLLASDVIILPSLYEPCGLIAMYAAKFGVIPILRHTGGFKEINLRIENVTGMDFSFHESYELMGLIQSVEKKIMAHSRYQMIINNLSEIDWSWSRSIKEITNFLGAKP